MTILKALAIVVTCLATCWPSFAENEKKAFVVGIGEYSTFSKLRNAPNDARLMAKALSSIGFSIYGGTPLIDLGAEELQEAFNKFAADLSAKSEVVIYFAGHGLQSGGENLLIPADFMLKSDGDAASNARIARLQSLHLGRILAALEHAQVPVSAIFLDCCRDPGFMTDAPGLTIDAGLAEPGKKSLVNGDLLICFAAKHGQTASDGTGENSPFASSLAKRIVTPGAGLRNIFDEITVDVMQDTQNRQQPFSYGTTTREIYLAGLPAGVEQIGARGEQAIGAPATVDQLIAKIEPGKSHADMRTLMGKPGTIISFAKKETGLDVDVIYESYATKHYGTQLFYTKSPQTGDAVELAAFTVHLHEGQALPIYRIRSENTLLVLGRTSTKEYWDDYARPPEQKFKAGGGRFMEMVIGDSYWGRRGLYLHWLVPFSAEWPNGENPEESMTIRSCGAVSNPEWAKFLSNFIALPISWVEER